MNFFIYSGYIKNFFILLNSSKEKEEWSKQSNTISFFSIAICLLSTSLEIQTDYIGHIGTTISNISHRQLKAWAPKSRVSSHFPFSPCHEQSDKAEHWLGYLKSTCDLLDSGDSTSFWLFFSPSRT